MSAVCISIPKNRFTDMKPNGMLFYMIYHTIIKQYLVFQLKLYYIIVFSPLHCCHFPFAFNIVFTIQPYATCALCFSNVTIAASINIGFPI